MQQVLWPNPSFLLLLTEFAKITTVLTVIYQMEIIKLTCVSHSLNKGKRDNVREHLLKRHTEIQSIMNKIMVSLTFVSGAVPSILAVDWVSYLCSLSNSNG